MNFPSKMTLFRQELVFLWCLLAFSLFKVKPNNTKG